jgi:peptidoglycan hydrolase-like protein with peptidoglycan-binding domain
VVALLVALLIAVAVYVALENDGPSGGSNEIVAQVGDSGPVVAEIQRLLRDSWGHDVAVDGSFGAGTASAVAAFQRDRGLPPTGAVDTSTYDMLRSGPSAGRDESAAASRLPNGAVAISSGDAVGR